MSPQQFTNSKKWSGKRRSQRIELNVSVVLHRRPTEGPQFSERTQTLVVNAHGALMALVEKVAPEQRPDERSKGETRSIAELRGGVDRCGLTRALSLRVLCWRESPRVNTAFRVIGDALRSRGAVRI